MMFDNTPVASPSRWEVVWNHLSIVLLVIAVVGFAAGLHLAATTLVVIAAGHLVLAAILLAARHVRGRGDRGLWR